MTAPVTEQMEVTLPLDLCAELGIKPGVRLEFLVREGKLEAEKVSPEEEPCGAPSLATIYTPERDAEEMTIQKGCSCAVPDDFPR
jgi:bifunctional DNA-binding transcriptional regulator/antitoxin component of YhaV-PrlF toxin-antitoxin module